MRLSTEQLEELRRTGVLRMSEEKGYQKEQKNNQRKTRLDIYFASDEPLSIHEDIRVFMQKMASGHLFTVILDNRDKAIINPHFVSCAIERKGY